MSLVAITPVGMFRDQIGEEKASRDQFFRIICPSSLNVPSPETYLDRHGWKFDTDEEGAPRLTRESSLSALEWICEAPAAHISLKGQTVSSSRFIYRKDTGLDLLGDHSLKHGMSGSNEISCIALPSVEDIFQYCQSMGHAHEFVLDTNLTADLRSYLS
ncbi:hypothetical protein BDV96DRAFT_643481 [Lophiotrema nucula]|uniref:Mating-type protein MAT-1 n=1 Tax=Lophiotrema nucula TaxID=690887 RepID=A0A6A5ZHF6_9PLEO|nr:hypothetical protein BDV96DRAFT_643481 [Lophiotrema nucula]